MGVFLFQTSRVTPLRHTHEHGRINAAGLAWDSARPNSCRLPLVALAEVTLQRKQKVAWFIPEPLSLQADVLREAGQFILQLRVSAQAVNSPFSYYLFFNLSCDFT